MQEGFTRDNYSVSDFIRHHLRYFVSYCEAVVFRDGTIEYSIPSHLYKMTDLYRIKYDVELSDDVIPIRASLMHWLCEDLCVTLLWYGMVVLPVNFTKSQIQTIKSLMSENIVSNHANINVSVEKSITSRDADISYTSKMNRLKIQRMSLAERELKNI